MDCQSEWCDEIAYVAVGMCRVCYDEWVLTNMTYLDFLAFKTNAVLCLWPGWR